jgi:transposase
MPKPLSNDLRKRIIEAKLRGDTEDKIAREKEVNKSTITKLWSLYRETGSYESRPNPNGRKPALSPQQLEQVAKKIYEQPDITLQELIDEYNLPVCVSALCRTVNNKLGLTFKKNAARRGAKSRGRKSQARSMESGTAKDGDRPIGLS